MGNIKHFNVASTKELCDLVKDTVTIDEDKKVLMSTLSEETEGFDILVKLTEENRRERQRRIDAGDETAKIKFSPLAVQTPPSVKPQMQTTPKQMPAAAAAGASVVRPAAKPATVRPPTARPAYGRLTGVRPVGPGGM